MKGVRFRLACRLPRPPGRPAAALAAVLLLWPAAAPGSPPGIRPSQVLVLYNADWPGDEPMTDPGQDSREVAEHYVRMHTDPATGEKPYLLGLRCRHRMGHLNRPHLPEESRDNRSGVVLRRGGRVQGDAGGFRDSRLVEFRLPPGEAAWRFDSLELRLVPPEGPAVVVVEGGRSRFPGRVRVQREGKWNVRLDGRRFLPGAFRAEASAQDAAGERHTWSAEYRDVLDVSCSRTGTDGVRDDRNYLEDVEQPVKAFLEDPANALPDGTLLRDHVLFIVVCYGLPRTTVATYGIARGVTDKPKDHGAAVSLEQRLQLLYYDVEGALGFAPRPHRFTSKDPFTRYLFRAPQAWPLFGTGANPFVHPRAYRVRDPGAAGRPLRFTPENRKRFPGRHLYMAMRIDGDTALQARALVDRAVYASRFAGPAMGVPQGVPEPPPEKERVMRWLWSRGWRRLGVPQQRHNRTLRFLWLEPGEPFLNPEGVYLPGGVAGRIVSTNTWKNRKSPLHRHLAQGVTLTAGSAAAGGEHPPHIHNKSWWDDAVLYPLLLDGYTAGEALLANQVHLEWITAFVGDPLLRFPVNPREDRDPPRAGPDRVRVYRYLTDEGRRAEWVWVDLAPGPDRPEVAQMRVTAPDGSRAVCPTFEGRPRARWIRTEAVDRGPWTVELVDPYGNRTVFRVDPPGPPAKPAQSPPDPGR